MAVLLVLAVHPQRVVLVLSLIALLAADSSAASDDYGLSMVAVSEEVVDWHADEEEYLDPFDRLRNETTGASCEGILNNSKTSPWVAVGVVGILILCGLFRGVLRKYSYINALQCLLPNESAACSILAGIILGAVFQTEISPCAQLVLLVKVLVPPIIFFSSLALQKKQFFKAKILIPTLTHAIFGTLLCAFVTGTFLHVTTSLPKLESYLFGALISALDTTTPIAAILSNEDESSSLYNLMFGESLLNNGVAIVLFQILLQYFNSNPTTYESTDNATTTATHSSNTFMAYHILRQFLQVILLSIFIGCATGALSTIYYWTFQGYQHPVVEVSLFFCWAAAAYCISEGLGLSGVVALIATAFILDIFVIGGTEVMVVLSVLPSAATSSNRLSSSCISPRMTSAEVFGDGGILPEFTAVNCVDDGGRYINVHCNHNMGDDQSEEESENISIVEWHRHLQNPVFSSNTGHLSTEARTHIKFVSEVTAMLAETAIFAYLGFFLFSATSSTINYDHYNWEDAVQLSAFAILACLISRAGMIGVFAVIIKLCIIIIQSLVTCCRKRSTSTSPSSSIIDTTCSQSKSSSLSSLFGSLMRVLQWRNQIVLVLAGSLRGVVPFALVESIPAYNSVSQEGSQYKTELKVMTTSTILCTIFFFSCFTRFVAKRLVLDNTSNSTTSQQQQSVAENQSLTSELEERLLDEPTPLGIFS